MVDSNTLPSRVTSCIITEKPSATITAMPAATAIISVAIVWAMTPHGMTTAAHSAAVMNVTPVLGASPLIAPTAATAAAVAANASRTTIRMWRRVGFPPNAAQPDTTRPRWTT